MPMTETKWNAIVLQITYTSGVNHHVTGHVTILKIWTPSNIAKDGGSTIRCTKSTKKCDISLKIKVLTKYSEA